MIGAQLNVLVFKYGEWLKNKTTSANAYGMEMSLVNMSCPRCFGVSQYSPVLVRLKCSYETLPTLFWSTEKNKSGRQPMAKESQRQKTLASPALALNQSKTACQVTAGEEAALSSMMTQLGARCRAAET